MPFQLVRETAVHTAIYIARSFGRIAPLRIERRVSRRPGEGTYVGVHAREAECAALAEAENSPALQSSLVPRPRSALRAACRSQNGTAALSCGRAHRRGMRPTRHVTLLQGTQSVIPVYLFDEHS